MTLAALACEPSIQVLRDPAAPIAPGASWAWGVADGDGPTPEDGALVPDDSVHRMIAGAIDAALVARGYPRVRPEEAQLVVHYHVARLTVTDTLDPIRPPHRDPTASGWGVYGQPEMVGERTIAWDEGLLVIDVISRSHRAVAWRGAIAGRIGPAAERDPEPAIREAVRRLIARFP